MMHADCPWRSEPDPPVETGTGSGGLASTRLSFSLTDINFSGFKKAKGRLQRRTRYSGSTDRDVVYPYCYSLEWSLGEVARGV